MHSQLAGQMQCKVIHLLLVVLQIPLMRFREQPYIMLIIPAISINTSIYMAMCMEKLKKEGCRNQRIMCMILLYKQHYY